ncbi:MAG: VPLPA-CTERM sorting domain-containing protein [Pseudomonadota bacterium]
MAKTTGYALITLLLLVGSANASLISTVNTDTNHQMDVSWYWDENGAANDTPALTNWGETVKLEFRNWLVFPGDVAYSTGQLSIFPFGSPLCHLAAIGPIHENRYGIIADFDIVTSNSTYHFLYDRHADPAESGIRLTCTRPSAVPIPGSIWLLVSGTGGLVAIRGRRKEHGTAFKTRVMTGIHCGFS